MNPGSMIQVSPERIEQAARVLAKADGAEYRFPEVRNRYLGLALLTVATYLGVDGTPEEGAG